MSKAYDGKNNLYVTIVSVSGGWTTVLDHKGNRYKLRNSQVQIVKEEPKPVKEEPKSKSVDASKHKIASSVIDPNNYVKTKSAAGRNSLDCGDRMARVLRGKTLDEVYIAAVAVLGVPEKELRERYAHLNAGMQRMNLANRMRAA